MPFVQKASSHTLQTANEKCLIVPKMPRFDLPKITLQPNDMSFTGYAGSVIIQMLTQLPNLPKFFIASLP